MTEGERDGWIVKSEERERERERRKRESWDKEKREWAVRWDSS